MLLFLTVYCWLCHSLATIQKIYSLVQWQIKVNSRVVMTVIVVITTVNPTMNTSRNDIYQ